MATDAAAIIAAARGWIGTPYQHQASLKGVACDCLGLLRGVYREFHGAEPEKAPPYTRDWAEAKGEETLYLALKRHFTEIPVLQVRPGHAVLFRMVGRGPAKHCGIVGERDGKMTLIHARQNKQVNEEDFSSAWRKRLAYAFEVP